MSIANLTAKYRPQRFDEAAGQEAIKRILSRASVEDRIAPAYLFSGTRGVGKTTLARVFAKAINCVTAPTGEPCNECRNCRQITAGIAPDVVEIDAATHGGVDEARRLKEDIGYAPLESRYKVFIIDEAHMLSKAAFNALLKTLEEPPGRVTFIMATTEPHKFPATIISRCQHYIFKRLTQAELEAHLAKVLGSERLDFDPAAVALLARRGAGSVRDSMSLMGQVLASGADRLGEQDTREILGLAGQDVFFSLIDAIHGRDCLGIDAILRQILDKGLDLGFFLRELTGCWRNMFILAQAGDKALPLIDASEEEAVEWLRWASRFPLAQIHACWQLSLEGQRRVMTSLEPALALELLLLNLAYLPMLVPLERAAGGGCGPNSPNSPNSSGSYGSPGQASGRAQSRPPARPSSARPAPPAPPVSPDSPDSSVRQTAPQNYGTRRQDRDASGAAIDSESASQPGFEPGHGNVSGSEAAYGPEPGRGVSSGAASAPAPRQRPEAAPEAGHAPSSKNWTGFLRHYDAHCKRSGQHLPRIKSLGAHYDAEAGQLTLTCLNEIHCEQLGQTENRALLETLARQYYGPQTAVALGVPESASRAQGAEAANGLKSRDLVKQAQSLLGAQVIDARPGRTNY
ncbi:MAG: DNA polymerase III subunit gamma/tau [Desulfovibrionaceae bacterium]|nr:DNA polymerase III subunit gamma/tau [Desulfovibrionaceae bacterium]